MEIENNLDPEKSIQVNKEEHVPGAYRLKGIKSRKVEKKNLLEKTIGLEMKQLNRQIAKANQIAEEKAQCVRRVFSWYNANKNADVCGVPEQCSPRIIQYNAREKYRQ